MGNIFCIIGKSSTGKDTLYQRLLEQEDLALKQIVSYTTRPIRAGEIEGMEYHFCSQQTKEELIAAGKVIELRSYHTCHGIWDYFTVDDGQIDLTRQDYLIIGTLESYSRIREYFSADKVIPIYIEVEDGERLQRALNREKLETEPKYAELCRRFLADSKDFSEENLAKAQIDVRFQNLILEDTIQNVRDYISRN